VLSDFTNTTSDRCSTNPPAGLIVSCSNRPSQSSRQRVRRMIAMMACRPLRRRRAGCLQAKQQCRRHRGIDCQSRQP
jgi:hypothetical protein